MRHKKVASHKLTPIATSHPLFHMTPPLGENRNGSGVCRVVLKVWSDPQGQVYVEWHRLKHDMRTRFTKLRRWLVWTEICGDEGAQQGMHQQELEGE